MPTADSDLVPPGDFASPPRRSFARFIRDVAVIIVAAIVISMLIKTFLLRSFYIPSESMEPTLMVNDRVIVNQFVPGAIPVERGDVVVFEDPGTWLPWQPTPTFDLLQWSLSVVGLSDADSNRYLIKRVIGLAGDRVACCDMLGRITVNGSPIEEPYVNGADDSWNEFAFDVEVPADAVWVMGDNRSNSQDSRYHQDDPGGGAVLLSNLVGRAVLTSWPLERWAWLDNYAEEFLGAD